MDFFQIAYSIHDIALIVALVTGFGALVMVGLRDLAMTDREHVLQLIQLVLTVIGGLSLLVGGIGAYAGLWADLDGITRVWPLLSAEVDLLKFAFLILLPGSLLGASAAQL